MDEYMLREPEAHRILGLGGPRSTYDQVRDGLLPTPVRIGPRSVAWPKSEVQLIVKARIAGKDDEQIRALVRQVLKRRARALAELAA